MPELFPIGYEDEVITQEELMETTEIGYREGVYFDPESDDFIRDGQHRVKSATGIESWEQWCRNCIRTERGVYPCYGDTFGIATEEAFKAESREKAESLLTREICEGLANDPYGRTKYVKELIFTWQEADALSVYAEVVGIDDATINITAVIDVRMR